MHLYVHVPFCARRCAYCDFAIAVRRDTPDAAFLAAIRREWAMRWTDDVARRHPEIHTIYFGGGTPSRLAPATIGTLVAELGGQRAADAEITLEANPDDITAERAHGWADAGITRVSLGVQSHDPEVLAWMHRTHTAEQVEPAVQLLHDAGIRDISIDLIFALPAHLRRDWLRDLDLTLALDPTHISLYGLTVEPHTPLARWAERGEAKPVPDERYAEEYLEAHDLLINAGFEHYEVSNFGRPGHRARHNSAYWRGVDYLGLGPSAHSLLDGVRRWNVRDWADYERRLSVGEPIGAGEELLDADQRRIERLYLGLRTDSGLPVWDLPDAVRAAWAREGWLDLREDRARLTVEGWLRLDALVAAVAEV
ncbi:MAG TPA: radical SAM family heme chaperone HemW [Gemmatimonadales bacterium]|nr:radical SAM family heme chaperone HemW [Gemmatimonadales bacterium]